MSEPKPFNETAQCPKCGGDYKLEYVEHIIPELCLPGNTMIIESYITNYPCEYWESKNDNPEYDPPHIHLTCSRCGYKDAMLCKDEK